MVRILNIVTPVTRPNNLECIHNSITRSFRRALPNWWVVFDAAAKFTPLPPSWRNVVFWGPGPNRAGIAGYQLRNFALELICSGWVYFLDDDNLVHPNLETAWLGAVKEHPDAKWFIFRQVRRSGEVYLRPHCPPRIGLVDVGQCIIAVDALRGYRFREDRYDADGELFQRMAAAVPPVCIDEEATFYNALR